MTRKTRKEILDDAKERIHEGFEEVNPNRGMTCSLFALSVILFNVTACLIVWWFVIGR